MLPLKFQRQPRRQRFLHRRKVSWKNCQPPRAGIKIWENNNFSHCMQKNPVDHLIRSVVQATRRRKYCAFNPVASPGPTASRRNSHYEGTTRRQHPLPMRRRMAHPKKELFRKEGPLPESAEPHCQPPTSAARHSWDLLRVSVQDS